jgi:hypothetical protein
MEIKEAWECWRHSWTPAKKCMQLLRFSPIYVPRGDGYISPWCINSYYGKLNIQADKFIILILCRIWGWTDVRDPSLVHEVHALAKYSLNYSTPIVVVLP